MNPQEDTNPRALRDLLAENTIPIVTGATVAADLEADPKDSE